jgi:hypothetical protein
MYSKQSFNLSPTSPIIAKKTLSYKDNKYDFYNVEKEYLAFDDVISRTYRSAIVSNGKLMCLAPAKSIPTDHYHSVVVETSADLLTKIVEGTMINLFWDNNRETWEIATRKNIGANCWYFAGINGEKAATFRDMFLEALGLNSLDELMTDPDFAFLNEEYSYSFILQHPKNHLVLFIENPAAYLVHIYHITQSDEGNCYSFVKPDTNWGQGRIKYAAESSVIDLAQIGNPLNTPNFVGVMKTNVETGLRTSFYSEKYLEIKAIRGNNPSLHYQYLMLRKIGKVAEFLGYFPQYVATFSKFAEYFDRFKTRLHQLYMDVHVLKKTRLNEILVKRDKYFVEKLHYEVYLPGLATFGKMFKVTKRVVIEFLDREDIMIPMGLE